jgi:hypothetical protein
MEHVGFQHDTDKGTLGPCDCEAGGHIGDHDGKA